MWFGRRSRLRGFPLTICSLFFLVLMVRLIGFFPYVYPRAVEVGFIFSFRLPIWLRLVVSRLAFNYKVFIAGLYPIGVH
jgi:hypothetical protein